MSEAKDHLAPEVYAGLDDARACLAEIWRNTPDGRRGPAMRALRAVISAEQTMRAADAFLLAEGSKERQRTFEALRITCVLRTGHEVRRKP